MVALWLASGYYGASFILGDARLAARTPDQALTERLNNAAANGTIYC